VTSIEKGAFCDCDSLESVIIPNSVTNIGSQSFWECSSLKSISIPEGVTSIEYGAFYGCSSLTSISIPESVTSIERDAFGNCRRIKIIGKIGSEAEKYCKKYKVNFEEMKSDDIQISNTFNGCKGSPFNLSVSCKESDDFTFECTDNCGMESKYTGHSSIIAGGIISYSKNYSLTFKTAGEHIISVRRNGALLENDKVIVAENHAWDSGKIENKPTCTKSGKKKFTCLNCKTSYTETVPYTGHSYSEWAITKKPTIFKNGTQTRKCINCRKKENKTIAKLKSSVSIKKKVTVKAGRTIQLKITKKSKGDKISKFTSSNKKVVTVNSKGKVTAKKKGKAKITVKMKSGCKATCTVTVK